MAYNSSMQFYAVVLIVVTFYFVTDAYGNAHNAEKRLESYKRFLLDQNSTKTWATLEQFAACSLTCVPGYEKLTEVCCNTGLDAVCLNLPWNVLKARLGLCSVNSPSTISTTASQTAWVSIEQFAACSLTCVHGYEKLADVCCKTGIKDVCSNLPWDLLKTNLGSCQGETNTPTVPSSTPRTRETASTTVKTTPASYWLPWGQWECKVSSGACFRIRYRYCSSGLPNDCSGNNYSVDLCSPLTCPNQFTQLSTTTKATTIHTTTMDSCQDDPTSNACNDKTLLQAVCSDNTFAWRFCPRSCNLCNTCWDYLNCSSAGAHSLFCGQDTYAVQYCRKTCGKCAHAPMLVTINKCGDPVANDFICELLQSEICICNDPDVRALCQNYCNNKCTVKASNLGCNPLSGSDRKRRDRTLDKALLNF